MGLVFSSARFEGSLNVDLNEITMNLVPFPRMHYLVSSQTPLYSLADIKVPARRSDIFLVTTRPAMHSVVLILADKFSPSFLTLLRALPYLAAVLCGAVVIINTIHKK